MTQLRSRPLTAMLWAAAITLSVTASSQAQEAPRYAGATAKGFLLPNGWTLKPAGEHVVLADLPLNIVPLADSRHALAATSGYNAHELSLIDLQERKVVDHQSGPPELVRPGGRPRAATASGGREGEATCSTPSAWRIAI